MIGFNLLEKHLLVIFIIKFLALVAYGEPVVTFELADGEYSIDYGRQKGKGAFGQVYAGGVRKNDSYKSAVVKVVGDSEKGDKISSDEAYNLLFARGVKSDHLIEIYGYHRTNEKSFYWMEEVTPLRKLIDLREVMDAPALVKYSQRLLFGLWQFLEDFNTKGLHHGDLRPPNLGFDAKGMLKVFDMDSVQLLTTEDFRMGTVEYSPPELLMDTGGGVWSDRYSLGVLLYELVTGVTPESLIPPLPRGIRRISQITSLWMDDYEGDYLEPAIEHYHTHLKSMNLSESERGYFLRLGGLIEALLQKDEKSREKKVREFYKSLMGGVFKDSLLPGDVIKNLFSEWAVSPADSACFHNLASPLAPTGQWKKDSQ